MDNIAGRSPALRIVTNLSVLALVILWLVPTVGLLVSSFRDRDQISASGWWLAPFAVEQSYRVTPDLDGARQEGDRHILEGDLTDTGDLVGFGITSRAPNAAAPGQTVARYRVDLRAPDGSVENERVVIAFPAGGQPSFPERDEEGRVFLPDTAEFDRALTVLADGRFRWEQTSALRRAPSLYVTADTPPEFTLENYETILTSDNMDRAFINTLTVTIPATIIPILIAAFAAYALAWMEFPGRGLLIAVIVGLLVVPLQLALVPLLQLHNRIGIGQSFVGIWLAHTGFGLPLAVYLLRNYMVGLPRDIIESAKVDGATDFQVFTRIVLPLSFPALASFAIFQFLWTWNDLLVAKVFLPSNAESWVMTVKIADDLLGSRGGDWGILASAAFVSIAVPLAVFFAMQKYLVRGLLAGSVK